MVLFDWNSVRNQEEQDDNAPRNEAGNQFGGRKAKAGR